MGAAVVNRTSSTASRPLKSTLTSARKTGTASKPMKLGAKRESINFEEAEARAKAEAVRIEKLGAEAVEQERQQKLEADREAAARVSQGKENATPSSYYQTNSGPKSRTSSEEVERLGMGVNRMSFGATPSKPSGSMRSGFGSVSPQVEGTFIENCDCVVIHSFGKDVWIGHRRLANTMNTLLCFDHLHTQKT